MKFLLCFEHKLSTAFRRDRKKHSYLRGPKNDKIITWRRKWPEQSTERKAAEAKFSSRRSSIVNCDIYKEGEMAALIESITSPNTKKSTATIQHSLWVWSPSSYRPKHVSGNFFRTSVMKTTLNILYQMVPLGRTEIQVQSRRSTSP